MNDNDLQILPNNVGLNSDPNLNVENNMQNGVVNFEVQQDSFLDFNAGVVNQNMDVSVQQGIEGQPMIQSQPMNQPQQMFNGQEMMGTQPAVVPQPIAGPQQVMNDQIVNAYQSTDVNNVSKTPFKYTVINSNGKRESGTINGTNVEEVRSYLSNEGYQVVSVTPQSKFLSMTIGGKLKDSELAFLLTQLSTYLKAGIPLIDSVKILEKQSVKSYQRKIFSNITYELVRGESFSNALAAQGKAFPKLLINMVKTAEMTGDLPSILDDMVEYYTVIDRTRKQAISAMTYPIIIFIFSIMVITFILTYIIPEFVGLFEQNKAEIPAITKFVLNTSGFITANAIYIVLGILGFILLYSFMFKFVKPFRTMMQWLMMHLPVIGNIMIYKETAMFTKTFASLLNHSVFITDSMAILSTVSSNEIFKSIINDSLDYLARGARISDSFRGKWAFPIVAYEMLVTGENTGRLPMMMDYVAKYYEDLHANYVKRINTFIEPVMIIFLALIVGVVVLSVIIPMFSFYGQVA